MECLNFSESRAKWAFVCDEITRFRSQKNNLSMDQAFLVNPVLQKWDITLKELPEEVRNLYETVKTYRIRLEGLAFSERLLGMLAQTWRTK